MFPEYPPEVLEAIAYAVYLAAEPQLPSSLDPVFTPDTPTPAPTRLPSSWPPSSWTEERSRTTLKNLCTVSRAFYVAAKPYVWRRAQIRLPRSWLSLVSEITGGEDAVDESAMDLVEEALDVAARSVYALTARAKEPDHNTILALRASIRERLANTRDAPLPIELLTPPESRNVSPMRPSFRHKSKSPGRWRVIRAISNATRSVADSVRPSSYLFTPQDTRPARHILHLDFNQFRTIGLRRSVCEGVHSRFVTGERLELALKEMPNLITFGATEYMDGALNFSVLVELLFRGRPVRDQQRRSTSRARSWSPEDEEAQTPYAMSRRTDAQALVALDLCGCISSVFVKALTDFVAMYLISDEKEEEGRGRGRGGVVEPSVIFPKLKRLCLCSVSSVPSTILTPFVLAFPSLTHLDLSCTRCTPELLNGLATSPTVRLVALSLARCPRLTSESVANLLIYGESTRGLQQLSLFGDVTCCFPLTEEDLLQIVTQAPMFHTGRVSYLDISSNPVTPDHFAAMPAQPGLRSLGLSSIPNLSLNAIADFLRTKAENVEVLTLVSSCTELSPPTSIRESIFAIHNILVQPLCSVPFSLSAYSLSLSTPGYRYQIPSKQTPTRLRVIEFQASMLSALGGGAGSWQVIKSKGARGWYVDTASGWVAEPGTSTGGGGSSFRRELPLDHPLRQSLVSLSESGGNVSTGVGWHSRKVEVLHGHGLLGRDGGLYGAVSFSFAM